MDPTLSWPEIFRKRRKREFDPDFPEDGNSDDRLVGNGDLSMRRMADDVMREMNNNLKKKEQQNGNLAMKGEFLAAGIKSEVEGIKSALTDVYKWVRKCSVLIG